jgi:hypothetical protein
MPALLHEIDPGPECPDRKRFVDLRQAQTVAE